MVNAIGSGNPSSSSAGASRVSRGGGGGGSGGGGQAGNAGSAVGPRLVGFGSSTETSRGRGADRDGTYSIIINFDSKIL